MGRTYPGVEAASESTIEITFEYRRTRCRERLKLKPTPANLKRAFNHRSAILDAIFKGTFVYADTFPDSKRRFQFADHLGECLTVEKYLSQWLAIKKGKLKASTWDDYRKIVQNMCDQFGALTLDKLTRPMVRMWLETKEVSNKRLTNIQSVLRAALEDAVADDILEANPLKDWVFKRKDVIKEDSDVDPFTVVEEAAILAELSGQVRNYFEFALWSGMRPSELIALRWSDIDEVRGTALISRVMTQASSALEIPKTKSSRREVKLLPSALLALAAQKEHTSALGVEIFHNPRTNLPWVGDQALRQSFWKPALARAQVRYRRPYQTRHTYASRMLTAGESPMWVAQQMGHADWGMIRTTYGKYIPDMQPDSGMKAAEMFAAQKLIAEE